MSFNNFHQSVEEILKTASSEQKIVWNDIFLRFGENISISQLRHVGAIAPFATYNARILFFPYYMQLVHFTNSTVVSGGLVRFYNENNTIFYYGQRNIPVWNSTAAALGYVPIDFEVKNLYFSRIDDVAVRYSHINFVGFRIGI